MRIRIVLAIFAIGLMITLSACGQGITTGNGNKIGQVIQMGEHGLVFKTWEGKLVRGGFNTGSGVNGGVFDFTVQDKDLIEKLTKAMESQEEVEAAQEIGLLTYL